MSQNGEGKGEKAKIGLSGLLGLLGGGPFMGTAMRSVLKGQFAGWAIHIQTFRPPIGCGGIPQPYTMLGEEAGLATVDLLYHACSPCIILYHPSCTTHPVSPILYHPSCITHPVSHLLTLLPRGTTSQKIIEWLTWLLNSEHRFYSASLNAYMRSGFGVLFPTRRSKQTTHMSACT
jgi:hypothetical protein